MCYAAYLFRFKINILIIIRKYALKFSLIRTLAIILLKLYVISQGLNNFWRVLWLFAKVILRVIWLVFEFSLVNGLFIFKKFSAAFRCAYCFFLNPARKTRPQAPRLLEFSFEKRQAVEGLSSVGPLPSGSVISSENQMSEGMNMLIKKFSFLIMFAT